MIRVLGAQVVSHRKAQHYKVRLVYAEIIQLTGLNYGADIEEAYQDKVNQFSGVLPPNVVAAVQAIGTSALSLNLGPYDAAVRNTINNAILSNTAATSGETATVVGALIKCLNTVYDDTPSNDCNPNTNPAVLQSNTK